MALHDYLVLLAYPMSGILGVLLARMWNRKTQKLTETAAYAAEVFDGWNELTQSQNKQLHRVEKELQQLRSEVLSLKVQLATQGCGRESCNIRQPMAGIGTPYQILVQHREKKSD